LNRTCRKVPISPVASQDGRINWNQSATQIHNLIRAVAPPYPGAFAEIAGKTLRFLRSRIIKTTGTPTAPRLYWDEDRLRAQLADGSILELLHVDLDGKSIDPHLWQAITNDPVYNLR